ncbi:MAG: hypothetical protein ACREIC_11790, partial [Limisphaerales bacterium]
MAQITFIECGECTASADMVKQFTAQRGTPDKTGDEQEKEATRTPMASSFSMDLKRPTRSGSFC